MPKISFSLNHFKKIFKNQIIVALVFVIFTFLIQFTFTMILSTSVIKDFAENMFIMLPPALKQLSGLLGQSFVGNQFIALGYNHPAVVFILIFISISINTRYLNAEIENRSIELLTLRLHPRSAMVFTPYIFIIFLIIMVFMAMFCGSITGKYFSGLTSEVEVALLLKISGTGILFFAAVGSVSAFISSLCSRRGQALVWNISIVLFLYVYDAILRLWEQASFLRPFGLFNWYQPVNIAAQKYDFYTGLLLLSGMIIIFLSAAIYIFNRRDL
jgi:ABC-2 type transport system permease protein